MDASFPPNTDDSTTPKKRWGCLWRLFIACSLLFCLAIGSVIYIAMAVKSRPEFYERSRARLSNPAVRQAAVQEFNEQATVLQEAVEQQQTWTVEFTDEQINAWLQQELPSDRRGSEPQYLRDPLVEVDDGVIRIGAELDLNEFRGLVSLEVLPTITGNSQLELTIGTIRAGRLPIPIARWLPDLKKHLESEDLPVEIADGLPPRLLIDLRQALPDGLRLQITNVQCSDGRISISGAPLDEGEKEGPTSPERSEN